MALDELRTLGRSGLAVSPLSLGAMTMGNPAWGSSDAESAAVFDAYVDAGGNSVDTADVYSGGRSEELVGELVARRGLRDRLVLATKYGFGAEPGNALAGGSGRKNMHRALEGSLRRLRTDYVDLYWMHVWDGVTPAEEVLQGLSDLVRAGTVRYYGLSDVPAWFAVEVATLARVHGLPAPVALQLEYSLVERTVEREHLPAALAHGMAIAPWSPLAGGFLTGKYGRGADGATGTGRLSGANPFGDTKFSERNFATLDALVDVAGQVGATPASVALSWLDRRPTVATTVIGARTPEQLAANVAAVDLDLPADALARLDQASAPDAGPYALFTPEVLTAAVRGGVRVTGWRP